MADIDEVKNNKILDEISLILSVISGKVSELNKCSGNDFVILNESLKKQYKRIEEISGNIFSVFEYTSGAQNQELFEEVQKYFDDFLTGISCSEKKFEDYLDLTEQIISYVNLMYIPLKNYLQNVVTLNFLANSLKFNLLYRQKNKTGIYDANIKSFTEKIETIKEINSVFDSTALQMKSSYTVIAENIRILQESNLIIKEKTEEKILTILKRLEEKFQEGVRRNPDLNKAKSRYTDNINKILTNLQYSDIIRQKIEHISEAHNDMILRIKNMKHQEETDVQRQFMIQIKDIADLQVAQLVRTNGEYQSAVQVISERFAEISDDVFNLTNDTLKFSGRRNIDQNKHYDFYLIETTLLELENLIGNFVEENNQVKSTLEELNSHVHVYKRTFSDFAKYVVEIQELEAKLHESTNISYENIDDVRDILIQIETVSQAIKSNYHDIKKYFSHIDENNERIKQINKPELGCTTFNDYQQKINQIYNIARNNNITIKKIVADTEQTEKIVSKEISDSIKEIRYYSLYEKTSNEIIENLKILFNLITVDNEDSYNKKDLLEHHLIKYTMESEREVHRQVTTGEAKHEEEEDEIEFF